MYLVIKKLNINEKKINVIIYPPTDTEATILFQTSLLFPNCATIKK